MTYTATPVIIDTDFATDVGDLGAIGTACALHRLGRLNILGITCGTSIDKGPGGIDAVCTYFNVSPYPSISTWKGASFLGTAQTWTSYLYDNYSHPNGGLASTWPNGTSEMRRLLASRSSADVVIIALGPLNTMSALLQSTADGYSALSGSALIAAKCKTLYVMGGYYPTSASIEWNFQQDPTSANYVVANWPTPIVFHGFAVGNTVKNGVTLATNKPVGNLLRATYNASTYTAGREAWDDLTVLSVANLNAGFTLTRGTNSVNASTGVNTFTANASSGSHYYVTKTATDAMLQAQLNSLLEADPAASPVLSTFTSSGQWLTLSS